ncbi:Rz1-like lysis system protein LysC [Acinetobacter colistiniresistens]|uniref:Rz1-like lysis system protein LysC n=1 Tax=Acinetobacter colistiniresistens TaxID=280145 RepID=UPI0035A2486C
MACSTAPKKHQVQKLYPVLSPCTKPIFVLNTNQDLVFALEQTELARSLCAAQVDAVIKIQEQP